MKIKKRILYFIIGLIFLALSGLITLQLYLLRNAYEQKEQAFKSNVTAAMNKVSLVLETNEAAAGLFEAAINDTVLLNRKNNKSPKSVRFATKPVVAYASSFTMPNDQPHVQKFNLSRDDNGVIQIVVSINDTTCKTGRLDKKLKDSLITHSYSVGIPCGMDTGGKHTASSIYYFAGENGIIEKKEISSLAKKNKNNIVNRVVDKLFIKEGKPIAKRVNAKEVDSLLSKNFREAGINIPYSFGITTGEKDSLVLTIRNSDALKTPFSKARLFPSDMLAPPSFLVIHFPDSTMMIIKEMLPILLLSLLFIIIIGGSFVYSIKTIISQKRFASHVINFINNMTHEFKTPISTISLASEAIGNPLIADDKNKLNRYNEIIKEENSRMRMQVEKILQMAVIEEKDYELDLQIININSIIEKTINNHSVQIETAGGKIGYSLNAGDHYIMGDQVHIANIINNVIENAVKYSPENIDITVSTVNREDLIEISISDKGLGIKEEDIKKVFDKYFRVSTGNTHDIKGFGLGLSYVKLMVEAHRGSINIKSKHGSGTDVIIQLPVCKKS